MTAEPASPLCIKKVAVVGAYGLVGREALAILASMGVPREKIGVFGSTRSAGTGLPYGDSRLTITQLAEAALDDFDVALFCTDAGTATTHVPRAIEHGAHVVDNSSAFRLDAGTPLVVPEVNGDELDAKPSLVANPNCSTIILLMAVEPFRRAFGVSSVFVSTYQAVSGAGRAALEELRTQTGDVLAGHAPKPEAFPVACAFNVFPHESEVASESGLNAEEAKIIAESRKILRTPAFDVSPTCVRVPVERCHSQSIVLELEQPTTIGGVAEVAGAFSGIAFNADPKALVTPRDITGTNLVSVSRARLSNDGRRLTLWVCGDQLRKGAALNAIQIAEQLATD